MKNHNLSPNWSTPFPDVHKTVILEVNAASSHKYGRGRARGRDKFCGGGHNHYAPNIPYKNTSRHQKWINVEAEQEKEKKNAS